MRANRGTLTEPGRNSPFRDRCVEENLDLFRRMRAGEFPNGARVLRAKIDMASGNINLRDPVLYRILHATHPRTGDAWNIYPSYDLRARPVGCDRGHHAFDLHAGIRGSPAALRLVHREPAGAVAAAPVRIRAAQPHLHDPVQARADRAGAATATSTAGTIRACRRSQACAVAACRRRRSAISSSASASPRPTAWSTSRMLDFSIREMLNKTALRRMAVLRPLKVVIENYPEGQTRRTRSRQSSRRCERRHRARSRSAAKSSSSRTTSWRIRRRSSSACRPAPKCGCAMPISSPAARW